MKKNSAIDGLRFVCNILVVGFHAGMFPGNVPVTDEGRLLGAVSCAMWWLGIPMLFVISGWCFFHGAERMTFKWWLDKLRNRVWRLLVPFLIWGAIFTALYCVLGRYSPRVAERLAERQITDCWGYLCEVLNMRGYILYGPLWFLRTLFACAIVAPLIGWPLFVSRQQSLFSAMSLFVMLLGGFMIGRTLEAGGFVQYPWYGFSCFGIGAWIAVNGECLAPVKRFLNGSILGRFGRSAWAQRWLLPTGMFVYVVHIFVNRIVQYSLCRSVDGAFGRLSLVFLLSFGVSVVVPVVLWHLLNTCCPRLFSVLDGRGIASRV